MQPLYEHQKADHDKIIECYKQGLNRLIFSAPTGYGKTFLLAHLANSMRENTRLLFVVDRIKLVHQAAKALEKTGVSVGIMQGNNTRNTDARIIVASAQTIASRGLDARQFALVVFDEVHIFRKQYIDLMQANTSTRFLGLTATPTTKGLGNYFDKLILSKPLEWLQSHGYLKKEIVFVPAFSTMQKALNQLAVQQGDYKADGLAELMNKPSLIGDIVSTWLSKAHDRSTLVFCVSIEHANTLAAEFVAAGVQAASIDHHCPEDERERIYKAFKAGDIQVLCSVMMLSYGLDFPAVGALILARPTLSQELFIQQCGRGLRKHPATTDCIILDHASNHIRHGTLQDYKPTELCTENRFAEKNKPAAKLNNCPECSALMKLGQTQCACGYTRTIKQSRLAIVEGELVELHPHEMTPNTPPTKQTFYLQLVGYAEQKNMKNPHGWAYHQYLIRYNEKPDIAWRKLDAMTPESSVLSFIKKLQKEYRKQNVGNYSKKKNYITSAGRH